MATKLTEELMSRISKLAGLGDFASTVAQLRRGNPQALSRTKELTIALSYNKTWELWPGPESMVDIISAVSHEMSNYEATATREPGRSSGILRSESSLKPIKAIASNITLPVFKTGSTIPDARRSDGLVSDRPDICNPDHPSWKKLAALADFPTHNLTKADKEILNLVERALIFGQGWGPKDAARGQRRSLDLIPSQLSRKGKKSSTRTYQRSISRLISLGLLRSDEVRLNGIRICTCAWWQDISTPDPIEVWRTATDKIVGSGDSVSDQSRTNVAPLSDLCRTHVAPPVARHSPTIVNVASALKSPRVRHLPGRYTSDDYINSLTRRLHPLPV